MFTTTLTAEFANVEFHDCFNAIRARKQKHEPAMCGNGMKDRPLLILAGVAFALLAWVFWHFLGSDAYSVLPTLMLILVVIDNLRLRRRLRRIDMVDGRDTTQ